MVSRNTRPKAKQNSPAPQNATPIRKSAKPQTPRIVTRSSKKLQDKRSSKTKAIKDDSDHTQKTLKQKQEQVTCQSSPSSGQPTRCDGYEEKVEEFTRDHPILDILLELGYKRLDNRFLFKLTIKTMLAKENYKQLHHLLSPDGECVIVICNEWLIKGAKRIHGHLNAPMEEWGFEQFEFKNAKKYIGIKVLEPFYKYQPDFLQNYPEKSSFWSHLKVWFCGIERIEWINENLPIEKCIPLTPFLENYIEQNIEALKKTCKKTHDCKPKAKASSSRSSRSVASFSPSPSPSPFLLFFFIFSFPFLLSFSPTFSFS